MARARRDLRAPQDIWPGFVDALSTILMVFVFLLVVFVLAQTFLSRLLQGKDETLAELQRSVGELTRTLALEREGADDLRRNLTRLTADLQSLASQRDSLRGRFERAEIERDQSRRQLTETERQQALLAQQLDAMRLEASDAEALQRQLAEAERTVQVDRETIEIQLAQLASLRRDIEALQTVRNDLESQVAALSGTEEVARRLRDRTQALEESLADANERTSLAEREIARREIRIEELLRAAGTREQALEEQTVQTAASQQEIAQLTQVISLLRDQLVGLERALDVAREEVDDQDTQIADLGRRLNMALAERVQELSGFRSDFFGRLRQVLGEREDVRVVGDRFVFQSEVLFQPGDDQISPEGVDQLADLARTLLEVSRDFPPDLPWIIQVDGHTDSRPINTPRFPSNWELSTARAISVAQLLIDRGIPTDRVAAAGFASYQPIDPGTSEEAYERNRRIEIKLTTR